MSDFEGFPKDTLPFLEDLAENNNRDWFAANRERYENAFLQPSLDFIAAISKPLEKVAPLLRADAKKSGGSLMRIYRDTRFSKEKTPYKTNIGINFRHQAGKDVHAPGIYIHVAADEVFLAAGMWRPDSSGLKMIRSFITNNPTAWKRMRNNKVFREQFEWYDDRLKTIPRGVAKDDPMVDELRFVSFLVMKRPNASEIRKPTFVTDTVTFVKQARPLMAMLCEAVGQPY